jgi:hypothetical protein
MKRAKVEGTLSFVAYVKNNNKMVSSFVSKFGASMTELRELSFLSRHQNLSLD